MTVQMIVRYRNNKPQIVIAKDRIEAMAWCSTRFKGCKVKLLEHEEHTPGSVTMPTNARDLDRISREKGWRYKN